MGIGEPAISAFVFEFDSAEDYTKFKKEKRRHGRLLPIRQNYYLLTIKVGA
jgi:hypothetical protein